jgi:hypothetical protein
MVSGTGFGGYFETIKFQKLELMSLLLHAGSQDVVSKRYIGLQAVQWTRKNVQIANLHVSPYKMERNWVNGLTRLSNYSHSSAIDAVPSVYV